MSVLQEQICKPAGKEGHISKGPTRKPGWLPQSHTGQAPVKSAEEAGGLAWPGLLGPKRAGSPASEAERGPGAIGRGWRPLVLVSMCHRVPPQVEGLRESLESSLSQSLQSRASPGG